MKSNLILNSTWGVFTYSVFLAAFSSVILAAHSTPAIAYDKGNPIGISCENNMYRQSSLQVTEDGSLGISDSYVIGAEKLVAAYKKLLGQKGLTEVSHVDLFLPQGSIECSGKDYLFSCSANSNQTKGNLSVNANFYTGSEDKISGYTQFTAPVNVKSFELQTVESPATGDNRIVATAKAVLEIDSKEVAISWNTFFLKRPLPSSSYCDLEK